MICETVKKLITYGVENNLSNRFDKVYITGKILEILGIKNYTEPPVEFSQVNLGEVLEEIFEYAISNMVIQDTLEERNLLEARIMDCLLPRPHEVIDNFKKLHRISPKKATMWFYKFNKDSNYIKQSNATGILHWSTSTKYGVLDLCMDSRATETIQSNNTEEEKYPKCEFCVENEGYGYNSNLRYIPITLNKEDWAFKYSSEEYFSEQFIVSNLKHINMYVNNDTFTKLFEFLNIFPQYFAGTECEIPFGNAARVPHEIFCGGKFEFAINRAEIEKHFQLKRFDDVQFGILNYPLSVMRLRYKDYTKIVKAASHILNQWKVYCNPSMDLYDCSDNEQHNTIVPVARRVGDIYELDLILRNNRKTPECPNGIFGTPEELSIIKNEPLKLIDMLGMAILPARLYGALNAIADKIINCEDLRSDDVTRPYADWIENCIVEYDDFSEDNIMEILHNEVAKAYLKILEANAVFKRDEEGQQAFVSFINSLSK